MGCTYSACWPRRGGGDEDLQQFRRTDVLSELGEWRNRVQQIRHIDGKGEGSKKPKSRKKSRQKEQQQPPGIYDSAGSSVVITSHGRSLSRLQDILAPQNDAKQGEMDNSTVAVGSSIIASVTPAENALSPEEAVLRPDKMSDLESIGRRRSFQPDKEILTATEIRKAKAEVLARRASEPTLLPEQDSYTIRILNPPYEVYRQQTLDMLRICQGKADDPLYHSTVELATKVFKVPWASVMFFNKDVVWTKAAHSTIEGCTMNKSSELPRHMVLSSYILLLDRPRVLVVEDVMQDGRFLDLVMNRMGVGSPYNFPATSFFAAAPILAPNGYVLGVLELMDIQPRRLDAGAFNLLINLAEMTARSLLRDTKSDFSKLPPSIAQIQDSAGAGPLSLPTSFGARKATSKDRRRSSVSSGSRTSDDWIAKGLVSKSDSAFETGILLCTAEEDLLQGEIQIANTCLVDMMGLDEKDVLHQKLKDLFHITGYTEEDYSLLRKAYTKKSLIKAHASLKAQPGWNFSVEIKSAKANTLDKHLPAIAVPNFVELSATREYFKYFFLLFKVERPTLIIDDLPTLPLPMPQQSSFSAHIPMFAFAAAADDEPWARESIKDDTYSEHNSTEKSNSSTRPKSVTIPHNKEIFDNVVLGPLLGRGSFGRVHRGFWNNELVAVKIIETFRKGSLVDNEVEDLAEARLVEEMQHDNIMRTYTHCTRVKHFSRADTQTSASSGSWNEPRNGRPQNPAASGFILETWLLLEYCDTGSLQDAIDRGWFRTEPSRLTGKPKIRTIVAVALEIAQGMSYLHGKKVLHSDLTPGNVLLKQAPEVPHGFSVRIADFGLSRPTTSRTINTQTFGTVTHMPPELLSDGMLTKAADVYAFGVLLWSMFSGDPAWKGLRRTQVMFKVTTLKASLPPPSGCPALYKELLERCMDRDHRARPTMSEIAEALHKLLLLIDGGDDMTKVSWKSRPKYNPLQSGNSMLEDVDEDSPMSPQTLQQPFVKELELASAPKLALQITEGPLKSRPSSVVDLEALDAPENLSVRTRGRLMELEVL